MFLIFLSQLIKYKVLLHLLIQIIAIFTDDETLFLLSDSSHHILDVIIIQIYQIKKHVK